MEGKALVCVCQSEAPPTTCRFNTGSSTDMDSKSGCEHKFACTYTAARVAEQIIPVRCNGN